MQELKEIQIFISYAEEDTKFLNDIKRYSLDFQKAQKITIWDDGNINLSREWDNEIKKHLNEADIILLFISKDFLLSDYINKNELKIALERHASKQCNVIPIFVRYCLLEDYPQITALQGFPRGKFFAELKEEKDRFYADLTEKIKDVIKEIRTNAGIKAMVEEKKEEVDLVLQHEKRLPNIVIVHSGTVLSNMMKQLLLKEIEGEKKHTKNWRFTVKELPYEDNTLQAEESSMFVIQLITSDTDMDIARSNVYTNNSEYNKYCASILWISEETLGEKLPNELKSIKRVVGNMSSNIIDTIYLLEKERQEFLKASKEKFSQQMNVHLLYDYSNDHENPVRIALKEKLENESKILTSLTQPPPTISQNSEQYSRKLEDYVNKIEEQLMQSSGTVIFYGNTTHNWYSYWQSEVQKIATLKSKAVCISEPDKGIKIKRDVSKSAFIVMDDEQKLEQYVKQFVERLK